MNRVLFIGLNPTKLAIPRKGGAWHRFCQWLDEMEMIYTVSFTNISYDPNWDGKLVDTAFLKASIGEHDKIVAWGPKVDGVHHNHADAHLPFTIQRPSAGLPARGGRPTRRRTRRWTASTRRRCVACTPTDAVASTLDNSHDRPHGSFKPATSLT